MTTIPSIYKSPAGEQAIMAFYDGALAHWPVPYQAQTIPTRHGDTFVLTCGDESAPPLVLLHGAGTNSAMWGGDVAEYSRRYRVIAVDLLGEAGKSAPNRPPWNSPAYAEWLEDVLGVLHVEKTTLIGISQGGWVALKFATTSPARVEKLVVLCPAGVVRDRMLFFVRLVFWSLLGQRGVKHINRLLYGHQPLPPGAEEISTLIMRHFKSRTDVSPIFSDDELKRLAMPVLLLGGEEDGMRDVHQIADRLRALLPRFQAIPIPRAGHALLNTTGCILPFLDAE